MLEGGGVEGGLGWTCAGVEEDASAAEVAPGEVPEGIGAPTACDVGGACAGIGTNSPGRQV